MPRRHRGEVEVLLYQYLTSALEGRSVPYPGCFSPEKKCPVPIVQEAGLTLELVWMGAENVAPPLFEPQLQRYKPKFFHFKLWSAAFISILPVFAGL
jgi:hypothetical protein